MEDTVWTQKSLCVLKEMGVYIQHCLIGVHIGFVH